MKRALLLLILVFSSACVGNQTITPKEPCKVQYGTSGVVISQLKPDYAKVYTGNEVRYSIEVTNLGEVKATDISLKCTDDSELLCTNAIFNGVPITLNPPDASACIEGALKQDQIITKAQIPTGQEPAYLKVKLSYAYSSTAWYDIVIISETQWKIRQQQGIKPVQSMYHSASPVVLEVYVPDAPVVVVPAGANEFAITVTLKNAVEGYTFAQNAAGTPNLVDSVVLKAIPGIAFISDKCAEGAGPTQTCTINNMPVTTEVDNPKSTMVKMKITSGVTEEAIYKVTAEAKYKYNVFYASPQGVEIRSEFAP